MEATFQLNIPHGRKRRTAQWMIPASVFIVVLGIHFLWLGIFPEQDAAESGWVTSNSANLWLSRYLDSQSYWLGLSYATSLTFASVALMRFLRNRSSQARTMALGGVTFSGFLAVAGCFLIGCCGSPMLWVYLSLFGATFIPWVKPLAFGVTVVSIGIASYRMFRVPACCPPSTMESPVSDCACNDPACN